ncbi:TRAP transporter small permease [[Clostridium] symbiosum]|uniref:TRAP transporter small permease n=1 Tax=Clostridium symbiosum TaxID=1512 RepID=UPI001D06C83C|nr:TRAP transporter small permease [[Clostridium] symbiosum]MCB6610863.1 TRAP transporter small permease [[Clostridium] symbiosum]MCB6933340.1 TRAP transporter small permease [[Clostridium] symbiosum]
MKVFFNTVDTVLKIVISILLIAMTGVIFYQVVMRYCFHASTIWAEEFARYAFIWVVMLGSACAVRSSKHIRVEFMIDRMSGRLRAKVEFLTYIVMIGMLGLLAVYGVSIAGQTMGQLSPGLHISRGFMYYSIPVGAVLMILFAIEILMDRCAAGRKEEQSSGKAQEEKI